MRLIITILLCAVAGFGQNFDQLTISPAHDGQSWVPGKVSWCQADGWPISEPECISLAVPSGGVTSYDMTFPAIAPVSLACVKVDSTGQWSFENCGGGEVSMFVSAAILLDQTTDNIPCTLSRNKVTATGVDVFYLDLDCTLDDHVQWVFRVPPDFTTAPTFDVWASSSATGDVDYEVRLRCDSPTKNELWDNGGFDATYTLTYNYAAVSKLNLVEVSMSGADMEEDDLCVVDFTQSAGAGTSTLVYAQIN